MPPSSSPHLKSAFFRCGDNAFRGHVVDEKDLMRRFAVEIFLDGVSFKAVRADAFDENLLRSGHGDGRYAFAFVVPAERLAAHHTIEARLANLGTAVGQRISLKSLSARERLADSAFGAGSVRWSGGLRLDGEIELLPGKRALGEYRARAEIDGEIVAEAPPKGWSYLRDAVGEARAVATFDLQLPDRFGDGDVHRVRVTDGAERELQGSPLAVRALPDRLTSVLAEMAGADAQSPGGRLLAHLLPPALPFALYEEWRRRFHAPAVEPNNTVRIAVVALGNGSAADSLESLRGQTHTNWGFVAVPTKSDDATFDRDFLLKFLAQEEPDATILVVVRAGFVFFDEALARIGKAFADFPSAPTAYSDFDLIASDQRAWPLCFSAFDYERLLEQGYCAHLFAVRRERLIDPVERGAIDAYRLCNAVLDGQSGAEADIVHIPYPLGALPLRAVPQHAAPLAKATQAHLKTRGISTQITETASGLFPAVRVARRFRKSGKVSLVVTTRNRGKLLQACLGSVLAADTSLLQEVIVVDNDTSEQESLAYLAAIDGAEATVLRVPGPLNPSHLANQGVAAARGKYVCLIRDDIVIVTKDWLSELHSRAAEPSIGAAGALVTWPNGVIHHGGMILGPRFSVRSAFTDCMAGDPGYADLLSVAHECSAVAHICLMTRRHDFVAVGGFDAASFAHHFGDIDFCLKLRARGLRIVFTPHAQVQLALAAPPEPSSTQDLPLAQELRALRMRWGDVLANDPYYNPLLALEAPLFAGLSWPPQNINSRLNQLPKSHPGIRCVI
jgi:hypothetical protein